MFLTVTYSFIGLYFLCSTFFLVKLPPTGNGFARERILAQMLNRRTKVEPCTNVQSKPFSPAFGNTLLPAGVLSASLCKPLSVLSFCFIVRSVVCCILRFLLF